MTEEWKDVEDFEGQYQVSNLGRVKSLHFHGSDIEAVLNPKPNQNGYLYVRLYDENHVKHDYRIHQLVAMAWIPNPENKSDVHHINEIKTDNRVENLMWVTKKENCNLGTRNERHNKAISKAVVQIDKKTGNVIARFDSIREAMLETGVDETSISRVCRKQKLYKTAGGFVWKFDK